MVRRCFALRQPYGGPRAAQHGTPRELRYTIKGTSAASGRSTLSALPAPACRVYPSCLNVNTAQQRREIHYSGRVQGVGFRFTTRAIAGRHPVKGFVKNLHDGRVLVVVEGKSEVLDSFLADLEAEMSYYIADKDVAVLPSTEEFSQFEVRR